MKLRYGTRGSPLALAQSDLFARELERRNPGLIAERVVIHTSGDRFSLESPGGQSASSGSAATAGPSAVTGVVPAEAPGAASSKAAAPPPEPVPENVKAMFVKEIEEALLAGSVDFAVHSGKDLPGDLPAGLTLAAFPEREDPRDAYIGGSAASWRDLKAGDRVATSSLRRIIQLKMAAPEIECVPMRGNVDTRLRKLSEGQAAGLLLARAGLKRLGRASVPHEAFPIDVIVPAPVQGALAIETREDRADVLEVLRTIDDPTTRLAVECERIFLKAMGGGCRTPLGVYARVEKDRIDFRWFWSDEEGRRPRRGGFECPADRGLFENKALELARALRSARL